MNKNSFILSFLLILSFYYSAFASDNLRGINSFFIGSEEMSGDKKKDCNLDKNKIIRSVKYLILEAKIPTTESYENNEVRSEEHTSELQSPVPSSYAVFCLKKKKIKRTTHFNSVHTLHVLLVAPNS